ncbi:hypothetical protein [Jannaschia sp. 2305UL9-9]|uniref:hypothetical protein n=1 Tax=Jannaschia sp. 2305UL9-9 TaxID=3121638 RepID=UPI003527C8C9
MNILSLLSDILLVVATLGLAGYCWALSRRLRKFDTIDSNEERRINDLSEQIDDLTASLAAAREEKDDRAERLRAEIEAADDRIGRLEVLLAGLEDIEADVADRMDRIEEPVPHDEAIVMPTFRSRPAPEGKFIR